MEERINILKADIEEQLKIIDRIYAKIQKRKTHFKESEENLESMALQIHNFYCAVDIEIDPERLEIILNFTEKAYPELKKDIEEFMGKLG